MNFSDIKVPFFVDAFTASCFQIFPCLQQVVMDPSEHVRQALASVLNDMSPVLGRDHTISHLLPMLLSLLRDTNPEVGRALGLVEVGLGV